jgi:hypothetical protein
LLVKSTGRRACIPHDVQGVVGRKGSIYPPQSFCKDNKTLKNTKNIFFGGGAVLSFPRSFLVVADGTVSDCSNNGHFCIVAGCTHIVTLLSRNGEPRRRWEDNIKMYLQKVRCGAWIGLIWLRIGTGGGHL